MKNWQDVPYGTILSPDCWAAAVRDRQTPICNYKLETRFFDFECNGKLFTQVALVFTPETPLLVDGKPVVMFVSEAGHDSAREFAEDDQKQEGPGPWLARRGVTVIATCRLGRWNFHSEEPLGSWRSVPLEERMPIFHREQPLWTKADYDVIDAAGVSSPTGSAFCRIPKVGSALEAHMLALTPFAMMQGYRAALDGCGILERRDEIMLLYWGFSTGGSFLWALAKQVPPDGIAAFGSANFPISYFATRGFKGQHHWLYDHSALRVRERNYADFAFFSPDHTEEQRLKEWTEALASARFKSFEDTFMFFNVAALAESVTRLWNTDFLPDSVRARGFAALVQENIELSFPDESLRGVRVLELSGTRDEIQPPAVVTTAASVTRPYCAVHQLLFLEGLHHSIAANQTSIFGSIWLDAIEQGFFRSSRMTGADAFETQNKARLAHG